MGTLQDMNSYEKAQILYNKFALACKTDDKAKIEEAAKNIGKHRIGYGLDGIGEFERVVDGLLCGIFGIPRSGL